MLTIDANSLMFICGPPPSAPEGSRADDIAQAADQLNQRWLGFCGLLADRLAWLAYQTKVHMHTCTWTCTGQFHRSRLRLWFVFPDDLKELESWFCFTDQCSSEGVAFTVTSSTVQTSPASCFLLAHL